MKTPNLCVIAGAALALPFSASAQSVDTKYCLALATNWPPPSCCHHHRVTPRRDHFKASSRWTSPPILPNLIFGTHGRVTAASAGDPS